MYAKFRFGLLCLTVVCAAVWFTPKQLINAATSDELQSQIDQQTSQLSKTAKQLEQAQAELKRIEKGLASAQSALPKLELQIKQIRAQIAYNRIQLKLLDQSSDVVKLEEEKVQEVQQMLVKASYADWRLSADINRFFAAEGQVPRVKESYYQTKLITKQSASLEEIQGQLQLLGAEYEDYDRQTSDLLGMNKELAQQKKQLEAEILALNSGYGQAGATVAGLQTKKESINEVISNLTVAQRAAAQREADILDKKPIPKTSSATKTTTSKSSASAATSAQSSATATSSQAATSSAAATSSQATTSQPPATSASSSAAASSTSSSSPAVPTFALKTVGRDYYQGHGVGLSQWGAHGMALNGLSYEQILKNYYANTQLSGGYENSQVTLSAGQVLNIEDYVAGLGEVPSKACGTAAQAQERPDKYIADNPNSVWDCWPEESIKAQLVAARSYALYYNKARGALCTTASCQVYQGGTAKRWAAEETKGQVMTYGGQPVEALYSSDNSQGYGTANNDTIFQSFNGSGTPYPYLRAYNDSGLATKTAWTTWSCTTNRYTYADLQKMFNYIATKSSMSSSTKQSAQALLNSVGTVTGFSFSKDPSKRVAKVTVTGTKGSSVIGGWWFKNLWNEWVYSTNRTSTGCFGELRYDYIYSQTIYKQ